MKRSAYYAEAEQRYVMEQEPFESIAKSLKVSERTLRRWAEAGKWAERRAAFLSQAKSAHEKTYQLYQNLLDRVNAAFGKDETPHPSMLYTLAKLAPLLARVRDYEESLNKPTQTPKGLSDETIALIEESVLGLKRLKQKEAQKEASDAET